MGRWYQCLIAGGCLAVTGCFADPAVITGATDGTVETDATRGSGQTESTTTSDSTTPTTDSTATSRGTTTTSTTAVTSETSASSTTDSTGPGSETGSEDTGTEPFVCPAAGSQLPSPPLECFGDGSGANNNFDATCWVSSGGDLDYTFVAPTSGRYTITTFEEVPASNTALAVFNLVGDEVACNTQINIITTPAFYQTALISVDLGAGQSVRVVVEFETGTGPFNLRIERASVAGGNCCVAHGTGGCSVAAISQCACDLDPFCCTGQWDELCVDLGIAACDALC